MAAHSLPGTETMMDGSETARKLTPEAGGFKTATNQISMENISSVLDHLTAKGLCGQRGKDLNIHYMLQ